MKRLIHFSIPFALGAVLTATIAWAFFGSAKESADSPEASSQTASTQVWTCSMHPQIRMDHKDICPLCGMDLTPVDARQDPWEAEDPGIRLVLNEHATAHGPRADDGSAAARIVEGIAHGGPGRVRRDARGLHRGKNQRSGRSGLCRFSRHHGPAGRTPRQDLQPRPAFDSAGVPYRIAGRAIHRTGFRSAVSPRPHVGGCSCGESPNSRLMRWRSLARFKTTWLSTRLSVGP